MKIIHFSPSGWEANSYLLVSGNEAVLIDAGVPVKKLLDTLENEGAKLKYILLTHGHFDHTVTADKLRDATGAQLVIHGADEEMLSDAEKSALAVFFGRYDTVRSSDVTIKDGDRLGFGEDELTIIHTPGHSKGSVCCQIGTSLFTGDTLFNGGYGRFDLHGGDFNTLCASLSKLKTLDGNLDIYPGHGDSAKLSKALNYLNFI